MFRAMFCTSGRLLHELFAHLGQDPASTKSESHQAGFNPPWRAQLPPEDRRKSELSVYSHRSNHLNHGLHNVLLGTQADKGKKRLSRRVTKHSLP